MTDRPVPALSPELRGEISRRIRAEALAGEQKKRCPGCGDMVPLSGWWRKKDRFQARCIACSSRPRATSTP